MSALDAKPQRAMTASHEHPALAWARSGAMALTGYAHCEPRICPAPLAACADGALAVVRALALDPMPADLDGARLLGERAAIAGHARAGDVSPGGACRLLRAGDGAFALNLARDADWELLPAWLECDPISDTVRLDAAVLGMRVETLVARGRELGLAIAPVDAPPRAPARLFVAQDGLAASREPRRQRPRVVDLSALWAGPLCSQLLQLGGADVVKVESISRPDGARHGPRPFFDLLNAGKRSVALDFATAHGRATLRALLREADIVIEASRPRALRQLGIDAQQLLDERTDLSWIALSGYGRGEPQENWIAYGDDAGVDAGLSRVMAACIGAPVFVGDAVADPLTGLHAAAAAWASWRAGGSRLISLSLSEVVRACIEFDAALQVEAPARVHEHARHLRDTHAVAEAPSARRAPNAAAELGADTAGVIADWQLPC